MPYIENPTLSALDNAGGAIDAALMAATRLKARMGYLASPEDRADVRDIIVGLEIAKLEHIRARRAASPTKQRPT